MFEVSSTRAIQIIVGTALVAASIMYAAGLRHVIRSDGAGYYAYLPAVFLHGNVAMNHDVAPSYETDPEWLRVDPATGRTFNKFPIGTAVLLAPFFLVAHALTHLTPLPPDGFSALYQIFVALAGLTYGALGLLVLRRNHEARFQRGTGALLLAVAFGTNLFHYFTYDAVFSHVYSFFLFASLIALTTRFAKDASVLSAAGLGVVAGLILLVRPTNGIALLFVPLHIWSTRPHAGPPLARTFFGLLLTGVLCIALCVPQLLYFRASSGHLLSYAYGHERFYLDSPMPLHVLVSIKKGLLFWTPMLLLVAAGQKRLRRVVPEDAYSWIAIAVLQWALVSCWWNWWYGGSFGHRAFTEYVAFFALPLGALFADPAITRFERRAVVAALLFELVAMALYWARVIPYEGFD